MIVDSNTLPIHSVIPALKEQLHNQDTAILEAAPGAGKTSFVPLALLNEPWLEQQKIIMLEPRKLAAKSAAQRLAHSLNEPLGHTIGYRIRHETHVSKQTRIEVVTEGVLTKMLQTDPSLEGVGLVIFDEFHERSIHSDLALTLCLQGRELFREDRPLKMLVMSATLDTQALESLLDTRSIQCEGRTYPIELKYDNLSLKQDQILPIIFKQVKHAIGNHSGDILVFLPGQKEILTLKQQLDFEYQNSPLSILPLYGNLPFSQQQEVITPSKENKRKIVLSTNIAQTSLTIEGIRIVIDSGLSREAIFDPNVGITRLHTRRVTQAESIQRLGRAGRTDSGIGYRWWSQEQQQRLSPQPVAEIHQTDLSSLVIELARWGVSSIDELDWLDAPTPAHIQQAKTLLQQLGLLTENNLTLTSLGENITNLPLEPRLARLILAADSEASQELAVKIASILSDKDPLSSQRKDLRQTDIETRLSWLTSSKKSHQNPNNQSHLKSIKQLKGILLSNPEIQIKNHSCMSRQPLTKHKETARLLAMAYPDRIGKRLPIKNSYVVSYKLSNGRIAELPIEDHLTQTEWIIAINVGSSTNTAHDSIYLASEINQELIKTELSHLLKNESYLTWPKKDESLRATERVMLGKLLISESPLIKVPEQDISKTVCQYIRSIGLHILPWDENSKKIQDRINFLHQNPTTKDLWPNVENDYLLDSLEVWLGPYLGAITHKNHLKKLDMATILLNQFNWKKQQELNTQAPEKIKVPSGSTIALDYSSFPPSLEVKLQEMFGCLKTPEVAGVQIKIALLSPSKKPLAVTQDLPNFWEFVYSDVKKEMRGRYPKHPWPDDPFTALATNKTNKALRR